MSARSLGCVKTPRREQIPFTVQRIGAEVLGRTDFVCLQSQPAVVAWPVRLNATKRLRDAREKTFNYVLIAAISCLVPTIFMTRVRLWASTCRAISLATRGSRLHQEVRRPHARNMVPKGCSTVSRRWRMASGSSSSLRRTASSTCSCSQRLIRRSLASVH